VVKGEIAMITKYRLHFYLNARHYVSINGNKSNVHPHTWEITLLISHKTEEELNFAHIEEIIGEYLQQYQGTCLNDSPRFLGKNCTMEQIGRVFFEDLTERLQKHNVPLEELTINENPMRQYIIQKG
jgi:6-pyruvoyltetrahydropterin/6-carboxytetrahydropterin synthase